MREIVIEVKVGSGSKFKLRQESSLYFKIVFSSSSVIFYCLFGT
jgi:hypothetical protein